MFTHEGIPYRNRLVGRKLAPFLADRLRAFFADPRIRGNVWVHSGSRSKAHQLYLWTMQHLPGFNLAANPNAAQGWVTWTDPHWVARGSWHMGQTGGPPKYLGAGAVDLSWKNMTAAYMQSVAREYGLGFPVAGEDWHCQAYTTQGAYIATLPPPTPTPPLPDIKEEDMDHFLIVHGIAQEKYYLARDDGHRVTIGSPQALALRGEGVDMIAVNGSDDLINALTFQ